MNWYQERYKYSKLFEWIDDPDIEVISPFGSRCIVIDYKPLKERLYLYEWKYIRQLVLEKYQYKCNECGITNDECIKLYGQGLHIHHIIPLSDYGNSNPSNLIPYCYKCHPYEGRRKRMCLY